MSGALKRRQPQHDRRARRLAPPTARRGRAASRAGRHRMRAALARPSRTTFFDSSFRARDRASIDDSRHRRRCGTTRPTSRAAPARTTPRARCRLERRLGRRFRRQPPRRRLGVGARRRRPLGVLLLPFALLPFYPLLGLELAVRRRRRVQRRPPHEPPELAQRDQTGAVGVERPPRSAASARAAARGRGRGRRRAPPSAPFWTSPRIRRSRERSVSTCLNSLK